MKSIRKVKNQTIPHAVVRLKAHPFRRKVLKAYRDKQMQNRDLSSSLDINQLISDGKVVFLDVDKNGVAKIDYSNPVHQKWLED